MTGASPARAAVSVAIDIGGTFTDVTLVDGATERAWTAKTPTTPADPSLGFMAGIKLALAQAGLSSQALTRVLHGTTVATNLILEGKGARAALLTTDGFRHVLEIGRQDIPRAANLFTWIKPKRPIEPQHIHEIGGRLGPDGRDIEPLDEAAVRAAAARMAAAGIDAVAICFLHAYANPAHERRARDLVLERLPDAAVSVSSDVLPVFREYERSMATILNIYVMPAVATYVARLGERLAAAGIDAPLLLMKSSGGVAGAPTIRKTPVQTALSGPAAGAVGAAHVGARAGFANLITIDIGGTSADICLIKDGKVEVTNQGRIGDWPLQLPMVNIITIGAGGGSIARVSAAGSLTVGPESAGALPGPACYGRGGDRATVTDAHLVLGHLPPALLDGALKLDYEAARAAVGTLGDRLGLDFHATARGILDVVNNSMVGAIRVISVERGHDPRDFALLPFGGAGPMHAGALARLLGIRTIVVPPSPGVLSALGLLVSDLRNEFARTYLQKPPHFDTAGMAAVFADLSRAAETWLAGEAVPAGAREVQWLASMRYVHQGFELTVPWPGRRVDDDAIAGAIEAFHRLHERLYTFDQRDTPVEIVTLRVTALGRLPKPPAGALPAGGSAAAARRGGQRVHTATGAVDFQIYDRTALGAGATIAGPAILTQLDCTTLVLAGQTAEAHRHGSLIIRDGGSA